MSVVKPELGSLEQCKTDVREKSRKESAERLFSETYEALLGTLRDTYPECKDLKDTEEGVSREWFSQFETELSKVRSKDPSLMLGNIPVLTQLQIPQLWVQGKFTDNSKKYMWIYITNLVNFANSAHASGTIPNTPLSSDLKDIQPPANMPLPGIKQIYDELPKNMLDKVKNVAEKYSQQIEDGETNVESLKFNEISKELFNQIDPAEMQQMVTSVGNMLQGVMGDTGNGGGGMAEMFEAFAKNESN